MFGGVLRCPQIVRDRPGSSLDRSGSSEIVLGLSRIVRDRPRSSSDRPGSSGIVLGSSRIVLDRPRSSSDRPGSSGIVLDRPRIVRDRPGSSKIVPDRRTIYADTGRYRSISIHIGQYLFSVLMFLVNDIQFGCLWLLKQFHDRKYLNFSLTDEQTRRQEFRITTCCIIVLTCVLYV